MLAVYVSVLVGFLAASAAAYWRGMIGELAFVVALMLAGVVFLLIVVEFGVRKPCAWCGRRVFRTHVGVSADGPRYFCLKHRPGSPAEAFRDV